MAEQITPANNLLDSNTLPPAEDPAVTPPAEDPAVTPPAGDPPAAVPFDELKNSLPDDLKAREEIKRINSFEDMAKSVVEKQKIISASVRIPDANASAEEIVKFYEKLGKPAKAEEYKLEPAKDLVEKGYPLDSDLAEAFRQKAFENNLTKEQTEKMYQGLLEDQKNKYDKAIADANVSTTKAKEALVQNWGDNYDTNISFIRNRMDSLLSKESQAFLAQQGAFANPTFLMDLHKLTKSISGDTVFIGGKHIENPKQTIESLSAQRDQLMRDDFTKNKSKIDDLNLQIVTLKQATKGRQS